MAANILLQIQKQFTHMKYKYWWTFNTV